MKGKKKVIEENGVVEVEDDIEEDCIDGDGMLVEDDVDDGLIDIDLMDDL